MGMEENRKSCIFVLSLLFTVHHRRFTSLPPSAFLSLKPLVKCLERFSLDIPVLHPYYYTVLEVAQVVELADTHGSGPCGS